MFFIISLVELFFFLMVLGNILWVVYEINKWFFEYKKFNFVNKLDFGILLESVKYFV